MASSPRPESWADGAEYEPFIGRWSRLIAREFLGWLARPAGERWLEVGCGTGALTSAIAETAAPAAVLATDRSSTYLARARAGAAAAPTRFLVADAAQIPVRPLVADVVVSGLVLNFLSAPTAAVVGMARAARPGGTVAGYVWDYASGMELLRTFWDAAVELDPSAEAFDEGRRFPLCEPGRLERLWRDAALVDVETTGVDVVTPFQDFHDYWRPFLGGQGPAPSYVAALDDARREALRQRLHALLPAGPDGRIVLRARAWAVRGRRAA